MSVLAQFDPNQDLANRRYVARRPLRLDSVLSDSGAEIVIHDLSLTGLLIETPRQLATGDTLVIEIPERGPTPATVVWSSGRFFGCEFELSIPLAAVSAALLQSPGLGAASRTIVTPAETFASSEEDASTFPYDDRYALRTRGVAILGLVSLSWALVGSVAWLMT